MISRDFSGGVGGGGSPFHEPYRYCLFVGEKNLTDESRCSMKLWKPSSSCSNGGEHLSTVYLNKNLFPVYKTIIGFPNTYPLDRDLSDG